MFLHHLATRATSAGAVAAVLAVSGCAASVKPARTPDAVARELSRALSDANFAGSYALLSEELRQHMTLEQWRKQLEANPEEVGEASTRLSHALASGRELRYADGTPLAVAHEHGRWLIAGDVVEFYDQSTPRAALRSFIAALQHRRFDVLLRLSPEADKEGVTTETLEQNFGHAGRDEIERLLAQLRGQADAPIEEQGDRATMPYAEHRRVQFVREAGRWRIEEAQ